MRGKFFLKLKEGGFAIKTKWAFVVLFVCLLVSAVFAEEGVQVVRVTNYAQTTAKEDLEIISIIREVYGDGLPVADYIVEQIEGFEHNGHILLFVYDADGGHAVVYRRAGRLYFWADVSADDVDSLW
ncbi:MAG: hypothetical protein MdMp014T_1542 [Treponematales bacterium]